MDVLVSLPPSSRRAVLPSHASAPGVPGGSASAETVTPLPGAVDEAQGVFELLLDGSFVDRLVREVYLWWTSRGHKSCWLLSREPWKSSGPCTPRWEHHPCCEFPSCSSHRPQTLRSPWNSLGMSWTVLHLRLSLELSQSHSGQGAHVQNSPSPRVWWQRVPFIPGARGRGSL